MSLESGGIRRSWGLPSLHAPRNRVRFSPGSLLRGACLVCGMAGAIALGQVPHAGFDAGAPAPAQLAEDVVANEVKLVEFDRAYLRYRTHVKDAKGDVVRDVIESKEGTVARIILRDDRPLTPDQDAKERERLQAMLDSPSAFAKHIQKDQQGKKLAIDLMKLLPQAMAFRYPPDQPQRSDRPAGAPPELVLDFKPNPAWNPPTMASQALTGLEGRCWIDAKTHNLVRMDADLFQPVNFGFGMVARLFPGGKFLVEQQAVGDQRGVDPRWIVNHFIERVMLRAMLVKTLKEDVDLISYDFSPIPEMGYREAIRMLLDTPKSSF